MLAKGIPFHTDDSRSAMPLGLQRMPLQAACLLDNRITKRAKSRIRKLRPTILVSETASPKRWD